MPRGSMRYLPESSFTPSKLVLPLHDASSNSRTLRIAALLAVWYLSSLFTSLSTKEILRVFPYPISLAAVQQAIAAAFGWATLQHARPRLSLLRDSQLHMATLPVATVMVIALAAYRWALMMSAVSFVHTVKTLGPIFTIAFSRLLLGEQLQVRRASGCSYFIYLSRMSE